MKVERSGPQSLLVDFDNEEELLAERANLAAGGLFLRTAEELPPFRPSMSGCGCPGGARRR